MTPETKGQPEPVAYKRRLVYSDGLSEGWVLAWNGDPTPKSKVLPGTEEEIRPLYDYDVPALLARQENLVEALEQCFREVDPDRMRVSDHVPSEERIWHICRTALAAAREES